MPTTSNLIANLNDITVRLFRAFAKAARRQGVSRKDFVEMIATLAVSAWDETEGAS